MEEGDAETKWAHQFSPIFTKVLKFHLLFTFFSSFKKHCKNCKKFKQFEKQKKLLKVETVTPHNKKTKFKAINK